ncbi:MAG: type II toxin-antitoxin system PemK/MazF family toxin [Oscillospiraceae bacterium]
MMVKRGEIYFVDFGENVGSVQGGVRPVLIVQNDVGNKFSPTVIAAAITSQTKNKLPTHIELQVGEAGLTKLSTVMLEQIQTIDKTQLKVKMGMLSPETMKKIDQATAISLGLQIISLLQMQKV